MITKHLLQVCDYAIFMSCLICAIVFFFFFFQAEDGIRDLYVTGVQTCALPILRGRARQPVRPLWLRQILVVWSSGAPPPLSFPDCQSRSVSVGGKILRARFEIGRASCRERV